MNKLVAYLLLVFVNPWFPLGVLIGFGCKALWGGQIVSLGTGVFFGILVYMAAQQYALR